MTGFVMHVGASAICPHGGQVSVTSSNTRVMLSGQPAATLNDLYTIAACPFMAGLKSQPCVTVQWMTSATRVRINSQPVILQTSNGLCKSVEQIPQGPPTVVATQVRVKGI